MIWIVPVAGYQPPPLSGLIAWIDGPPGGYKKGYAYKRIVDAIIYIIENSKNFVGFFQIPIIMLQ